MRIPVSSDARRTDVPTIDSDAFHALVESFDHRLKCGTKFHQGDSPVRYLAVTHDCQPVELWLCHPCLDALDAAWDRKAEREGGLTCPACGKTVRRWRDLVRIIPIGGAP